MSKQSSRRRTIIIVLAALVVVAAGIFILTRPKKAKYKISVVERGNVSVSVSATGTVNPVSQVTVGSQVSGTLEKVSVDFNDHVTAGQLLAKIDPRNYESALKQARASLASAQASLTQAQLSGARAETLYSARLLSYSDYLQAKTDLELAKAKRDQAQASYEQAQTNLAYTTITAPMSGVVVARKVESGQTVAASLQSPDLFTIADLSQMQVEVSIDEADVGKLDTGLSATFNVDAYPESTFSGKLVQVRNQPVVSSNVTTYIGIVRVANPGLLLKPGMTANVKIIVRAVDNVLTVPNAALSTKLASTLGFSSASRTRTLGPTAAAGGAVTGAARGSLAAGHGTAMPSGRGQSGGRGFGGRGQHGGFRPGAAASGDSSRAGAHRDTVAGAVAASPAVIQTVYVLQNGKPIPREVETGMADGSNTEILRGIGEGELVVTGLGQGKSPNGPTTQRNRIPMMGGFGGPH
jgi:HlyD family secretion protein